MNIKKTLAQVVRELFQQYEISAISNLFDNPWDKNVDFYNSWKVEN